MKKYLIVLLSIILLGACNRSRNTNGSKEGSAEVMELKRLESLKNDTSITRLVAYNNIPISSRQESIDSIIQKDSTFLDVRNTNHYDIRKIKELELSGFNSSSEYALLSYLGYGDLLDRYSISDVKNMGSVDFKLDYLKESLRGAATFGCMAFDHYLRNSYSTKIVVEVDIWGIERSGFFNGRGKWAKGFENQRV